MHVLSSAGTYIKEFVHGDLDRTMPNVGSLTENYADIFLLDVIQLYEKMDQNSINDFAAIPF